MIAEQTVVVQGLWVVSSVTVLVLLLILWVLFLIYQEIKKR